MFSMTSLDQACDERGLAHCTCCNKEFGPDEEFIGVTDVKATSAADPWPLMLDTPWIAVLCQDCWAEARQLLQRLIK